MKTTQYEIECAAEFDDGQQLRIAAQRRTFAVVYDANNAIAVTEWLADQVQRYCEKNGIDPREAYAAFPKVLTVTLPRSGVGRK